MKKYAIPLSHSLSKTAYCIQKKDLVTAARVMAAAFSEDASIRYLLGGKNEGKHDWRYFLCVLKAVYGKCVMLSADEQIRSLLILFPPPLGAVPTWSFMGKGGLGLLRHFGVGLFIRSIHYENNCRAVKGRYATPDMWYCLCFAVAPERQGKGAGSQLIRPVLDIFQDKHIPLYLETHKATNVEIYKHYGFKVVDRNPIPKTNIIQYAMMRFDQ